MSPELPPAPAATETAAAEAATATAPTASTTAASPAARAGRAISPASATTRSVISKAAEGRRAAAASALSPSARGIGGGATIGAGVLPVRIVHVDGVAAHIRVVAVVVGVIAAAVVPVVVVSVGVVATAVVPVVIVVGIVVAVAVVPPVPRAVTVVRVGTVVHPASVPVAVPTAVPPTAATSAHHGADRHSSPKRKQAGRHHVSSTVRRSHIRRNHIRCAVNDRRVVLRDIHDLGIRWLDDDRLRRLLYHRDLRTGLEIAGSLGLGAQGLDGSNYVGRLVVIGLAQLRRP